MGVTNRNELKYKSHGKSSSTESLSMQLQIPRSNSDTSLETASIESLPLATEPNYRPRKHKFAVPTSFGRSRALGRRKQRRLKTVCELEALIEEDELNDADVIPHNSIFTKVLEDTEAGKVWNAFLDKDEDAQRAVMNTKEDKLNVVSKQRSALQAYQGISSRTRLQLKGKTCYFELRRMEEELLDFFDESPNGVYKSKEKTSYQRLLMHGVAQYYTLVSKSFNDEDGKRVIKVENPNDCKIICEEKLCDFMENNLKKIT